MFSRSPNINFHRFVSVSFKRQIQIKTPYKMASNVPTVKLNSGHNIPILGLGTWNVSTINANIKWNRHQFTVAHMHTYINMYKNTAP